MKLIRLWDERDLLLRLKEDTFSLIRIAHTLPPIKKLVEAADILDLTAQINEKFPTEPPDLPVCDKCALLRLRGISGELYIYHRDELPAQHLILYGDKIQTLLAVYRLPRESFT